jgi:ribosomal-protein-alanine N-acetyltransferase
MTEVAAVETANLRLDAIAPETLEALISGDVARASAVQGLDLSGEFADSLDDFFARIQLGRMRANPDGRGWCARTMVRKSDEALVGHCGFHGPPEDIGRAEIGYTVLTRYRGHGYATEAAAGLVAFAAQQGVPTVFATVLPTNLPSLRVVAKLGFVQTNEVEGEELLFELALSTPARTEE